MGEAPKTHLTIPLEGDQQPTESDETFPEVGQAGVWDTIEELDNSSWTFCSQFWALFSQVLTVWVLDCLDAGFVRKFKKINHFEKKGWTTCSPNPGNK